MKCLYIIPVIIALRVKALKGNLGRRFLFSSVGGVGGKELMGHGYYVIMEIFNGLTPAWLASGGILGRTGAKASND